MYTEATIQTATGAADYTGGAVPNFSGKQPVYVQADYTQPAAYPNSQTQKAFQVIAQLFRDPVTQGVPTGSDLSTPADGTAGALSPWWYLVAPITSDANAKNPAGLQLYHESELLNLTDLKTYLDGQNDNWVDPVIN